MECLVTRLKGTVTADLPKLGELKLKFKALGNSDASKHRLVIASKTPQTITITGAHFTDKTMSADLGIEATVTNTNTELYISDGDCAIVLPNKYVLTYLNLGNTGVTGDLSSVSGLTALTYLNLGNTGVTGDLSSVSGLTALTRLNLYNAAGVTGDLNSVSGLTALINIDLNTTRVTGDLSSVSGLTALTRLNLYNAAEVGGDLSGVSRLTALTDLSLDGTGVGGDLRSVSELTALINLGLSTTRVTGDLSSVSGLTALTRLTIKNGTITGDSSSLPSSVKFLSTQNAPSILTWKTIRPSSANIIAMESVNLANDVDAMLINQANCVASFGGTESWYRRIQVSGTRTSASDAAVETLKTKGYTVIVNGVTL